MGASIIPAVSANTSDNWVQISSVTASGTSTSFTSISGYKKLMLRGASLSSSSNTAWTITFNSDTGAKYDYSYAYADFSASSTYGVSTVVGNSNIAFPNNFSSNVMLMITINNTDTTGLKTLSGAWAGFSGTNQRGNNIIGSYLASASISTITVAAAAGGMGGTLSLYGVAI